MKLYVSKNIKNYRLAERLTQKEFGEILGVSPQAVSKWENETAYPDIFLLPTIAETLYISIDALITSAIDFTK